MTLVFDTVHREALDPEDAGPSTTSLFETACAVARSALERRRGAVRSVLLSANSEETRVALRGLAAWYERMCVDPDYGKAPPEEGVRALIALGDEEPKPIKRQLAVAYWAIRVAQELASCQVRWSSEDSTPDELQLALTKLDLALIAASSNS